MKFKKIISATLPAIFVGSMLLTSFVQLAPQASAQTQNLRSPTETLDLTSKYFSLVVCDGPTLPRDSAGKLLVVEPTFTNPPHEYRSCNFDAVIKTIQHLINVMILLGVLATLAGFAYAGYLYMTGVPGNITKANESFRKVATGFIIMLTAWFVVYQVLTWLTDNSAFKVLLGK